MTETAKIRWQYDEARQCFVYEINTDGVWMEVSQEAFIQFQKEYDKVIWHVSK